MYHHQIVFWLSFKYINGNQSAAGFVLHGLHNNLGSYQMQVFFKQNDFFTSFFSLCKFTFFFCSLFLFIYLIWRVTIINICVQNQKNECEELIIHYIYIYICMPIEITCFFFLIFFFNLHVFLSIPFSIILNRQWRHWD